MHAKNKDAMVLEYSTIFILIGEIVRYKEGKKLPVDFQPRLAALQTGIMKLYGDLLVKAIK